MSTIGKKASPTKKAHSKSSAVKGPASLDNSGQDGTGSGEGTGIERGLGQHGLGQDKVPAAPFSTASAAKRQMSLGSWHEADERLQSNNRPSKGR